MKYANNLTKKFTFSIFLGIYIPVDTNMIFLDRSLCIVCLAVDSCFIS